MSHTSVSSTTGRLRWRVVDIIVAAVLGVACGFIMWVWNGPGYALYETFNAVTPGLGGLVQGLWLLGGPLGGLIIRKPGASIFVTMVAVVVSMLFGSPWGVTTILFGLAEGIGAELFFAVTWYRRFGVIIAIGSGVVAGAAEWASELVTGNMAKSATYNLVYLLANAVSGAVLAGVLGWIVTKALARTGVLNQFAAGRE